jgi:DNA-binding NtrC family response regulator
MKVTRVLVVDDCRLTRRACQAELGPQRQTLLAGNPADALKLSAHELDLAIVDQRLGQRATLFCAGIQLVGELKKKRPDLCVVMVSGLLTPETESMARNRRADLVLEKIEDARGFWWIPVAQILAFAEDGIQPSRSGGTDRSLARVDRDYILDVYRRCNGNVSQAARILDIPRPTVHSHVVEFLGGDPQE